MFNEFENNAAEMHYDFCFKVLHISRFFEGSKVKNGAERVEPVFKIRHKNFGKSVSIHESRKYWKLLHLITYWVKTADLVIKRRIYDKTLH